jgi:hypothetical protein
MMLRRTLLAAIAASALADTRAEIVDLFGAMAGALSEADPETFLRAIDPSLPDYGRFVAGVRALALQNDLSSSIEIVKQEGSDAVQVVELDWLLEIRGEDQSHIFQRRQAIVKCRLERKGRKWRIVSLDPQTFFAPPSER